MRQYTNLLSNLLNNGTARPDRTGTGTFSIFSPPDLEFDLRESFPIITTKKINWLSVVRELQWILRGQTNVKDLHPVKIWDKWADEHGELGPIYGQQLRGWSDFRPNLPRCIDQLQQAIDLIKSDPYSRRILMTTWNVADLDKMRLPPCHGVAVQFYVGSGVGYDEASGEGEEPRWLDCKTYQRSADVFLGLPFNISQYALLTCIIAKLTGLKPRRLIISLGDAHLYKNHVDQAELQLSRCIHPPNAKLVLPSDCVTIDDYGEENPHKFRLVGYEHEDAIHAEISV